jgi:Nitrate/nitrite transporter
MINKMKTRENLTKKRWLVLLASCVINLCIGALYAWSVFAAPMAAHITQVSGRELTASDLAVVFSVGNGLGFLTMISGGFFNQKIGPRLVIFTGGVLFGFGFVICAMASSVAMLVVGYGLFSGLAMGLAYGCTISNSVKFFPDKAGFAGGVATASYGISSVLVPPIANALIDRIGVSSAFMAMGIAIIVIVGIFSQMIIKCPDHFQPDGWTPAAAKELTGSSAHEPDKDWREMVRMPIFYLMLVMLFFGAVLGMMAISQASSIAQHMIGMTPAEAAVAVSVLALFNTFGRVVAGKISDKIGCIQTVRMVFFAAIAAMAILYLSGSQKAAIFYTGICLAGICFGAFMGVYPSFTAEQFGRKNSSVNYGIMFIGFNLAGLVGPMIVSFVFQQTGDYRNAFLIALVFAAAGLCLSFAYRKMLQKGRQDVSI